MSAKPKLDQIPKQVKVAKDLLDLLTGAMYVNPFSALREYIQNSVDAIEDAAATGILATTSQGRIDISVSPENRSIVIRDNGIGCANKDFTASLTAFGGSDKRGRDRRGFRGIGRLAGLAYCRELAFRGRAAGDSRVFEMVWDCVKVKGITLFGRQRPFAQSDCSFSCPDQRTKGQRVSRTFLRSIVAWHCPVQE